MDDFSIWDHDRIELDRERNEETAYVRDWDAAVDRAAEKPDDDRELDALREEGWTSEQILSGAYKHQDRP